MWGVLKLKKIKRFHRSFYIYAFILLIIFILTACSSEPEENDLADSAAEAPEPEEGIEVLSHLPVQPLDTVLIIDQSGSMSGTATFPATDPDDWRVRASHYIVENIAAKKTTDAIPKVGVVHFGTQAPDEYLVPLTKLESIHDVQTINKSIEPMNLGWTNFLEALQKATNLFEEANTFEQGRQASIIILTDGEPADARRLTVEEYFNEIEEFIDPFFSEKGIDLFVVGIDDADMGWTEHYKDWEVLLPTENSSLFDLESMQDLPRVFNDIVRIFYDIPEIDPVIISDTEELEFEIPAYLEVVEFHVFPKTPELTLNVIRPDGSLIKEGDHDAAVGQDDQDFYIITIKGPEPGTWQYKIEEGQGKIEVFRNMVPVKLHLRQPKSQVILGTKQKIEAEFSKQDGTLVEEHPDYPIQIDLLIEDPSGTTEHYIMDQDTAGIYVLEEEFAPQEEGRHSFVMEVEAPGAFSYTDKFAVKVVKQPYLNPITPEPNEDIQAGSEVTVEVEMLAGFEPIEFADHFTTRETALVIAWFKPEGEEESSAYYLHPTGEKSRLAGYLPYEVIRGNNQVRYRVVGELIDGKEHIGEDLIVKFTGEVPFWVPLWPWAAGLIVLAGCAWGVTYSRRPSWSGYLEIRHSTDPQKSLEQIDLDDYGKKKQLTVGKGGDIPLEDPDFGMIEGKMVLVKKEPDEFDDEPEFFVPQLNYRIQGGDFDADVTLENNYEVQVGPFLLTWLKS